jgi:hypothetical protein
MAPSASARYTGGRSRRGVARAGIPEVTLVPPFFQVRRDHDRPRPLEGLVVREIADGPDPERLGDAGRDGRFWSESVPSGSTGPTDYSQDSPDTPGCPMLRRAVPILTLPLLLTACGVGETAATAAAGGASSATGAAQARQVLDAVQQQLDLGAREAEERLRAAEEAGQ